ncbi:MAG TPA: chloride channel protein [Humibacter sp.]|nr:chloride channel protein [Humibacter sp.]
MIDARRFGAVWLLRFAIVTVLTGIGAGIGGLLLTLLLRAVEHLALGYSSGTLLEGAESAPAWRRFAVVTVAGVVGALGWYAIRRWGSPIASIKKSVNGRRMPWPSTLANVVLQIVVVGLGASVGREVAPRELGALLAGWLSERVGLSARDRRIIIACGAGAGLAAVYSVPLGGTLFAVEILLAEVSISTVVPALAASAIATLVASVVVPGAPLYSAQQFSLSPAILVGSLVLGPVLGVASAGFVWCVRRAQHIRPAGWHILVVMPVVFAGVGVLAFFWPAVLGNGRSLGQLAFDGALPLGTFVLLSLIKAVATTATIGAGAAGGTLTPSLSIGAGLGASAGLIWAALWPGAPIGAFALIGSAAFLAANMRAPLTGLVLVVEFTHEGVSLLPALLLAVAGASLLQYLIEHRRLTGVA